MDEIERLIDEARNIGRLICPLPQELDDGAPINRMPDDLMRAAAANRQPVRLHSTDA